MATNPDNVGGLPELPEPTHIFCSGCAWDCGSGYTADQMRAYGELCRAVPAGGDEPETMSPPEFDGSHVGIEDRPDMWPDWVHRVVENAINEFGVVRDNERQPQGTTSGGSPDYSRITPPDSAPAGSGEVDLSAVAGRAYDFAWDCQVIPVSVVAALLRKLQQGAEYRILVAGEVMRESDEFVTDNGMWSNVRPPFVGMRYQNHMRTVRRAASQGQEGGK